MGEVFCSPSHCQRVLEIVPSISSMPKPEAPHRLMLSEVLQSKLRAGHYSRRTEGAYRDWVRRFIRHHERKHPRALGEPEVASFLTYLAVEQNLAAATQIVFRPQVGAGAKGVFRKMLEAAWQGKAAALPLHFGDAATLLYLMKAWNCETTRERRSDFFQYPTRFSRRFRCVLPLAFGHSQR